MRPGRELDAKIAQEVFGYEVFMKQKVVHERTSHGDRPLRKYSKEIEWAFEVAKKMNITIVPIENGEWFAIVGQEQGWNSPAQFVEYLLSGQFTNSGAAVGADAPLTICLAALKALESRRANAEAAERASLGPGDEIGEGQTPDFVVH